MQAEFETSLGIVFREAQLLDAAVYMEDFDALCAPDRNYRLDALTRRLGEVPSVVILAGQHACDSQLHTVTRIAFVPRRFTARYRWWAEAHRGEKVPAATALVGDPACRYRLTGGEIRQSVGMAVRQAALNASPVELEDLASAVRTQSHRDLGSLARN